MHLLLSVNFWWFKNSLSILEFIFSFCFWILQPNKNDIARYHILKNRYLKTAASDIARYRIDIARYDFELHQSYKKWYRAISLAAVFKLRFFKMWYRAISFLFGCNIQKQIEVECQKHQRVWFRIKNIVPSFSNSFIVGFAAHQCVLSGILFK